MKELWGASWGYGVVLAFGCWLGGCQAVAGDYHAGSQPDAGVATGGGGNGVGPDGSAGNAVNPGQGGNAGSGGEADAGDAGTPACDSDGTYRCTDTALEVCQNHQWQPRVACTKELCDAERGRCMTCAPGAFRCTGWNLETCASTGDSWTIAAACDTAAYCDSVSKTCLACLAGETFCSGTRLYICKPDKSGWNVTDCQDANLCNARVGSCRPCVTGEYQCNEASLQVCDSSQAWVQADLCASPELCQASLAAHASDPASWSGSCQPPGCNAGDYRCNPSNLAQLQGCPPSELEWVAVETCLTSALCNPVGKQCDQGCVPGTYQCTGAQLELCRQDGTGFDLISACQDAAHCNTQQHDCVACVEGQSQCNGATLETCGTDLAWTSAQACASAALCDAPNSQCLTPGCPQAGAFSCNGADLRICPPDLVAWAPRETCITAALCDASNGRCNPPECTTPGEYRCQGNTREQCDEATRSWVAINTCLAGQVCDLGSPTGCLGTCPAVTTRCNTTDVEKCVVVANVPQWQFVESCASSALCVASASGAACNPPVCAVNQYQCSGSTLQRCNAGRTGWDTVRTCTAAQICDATGAQCDTCVPNTYACNSANLTRCSTDGQSRSTVETCATAARCYASSDQLTGYCYRCDTGNVQCVGTSQIRTCATDRLGWNTATSCANGCQNNTGDNDYCAACAVANEIQCVQTATPGSTRTCPANRSAWGATTTCSQGHGCIDNGTSDYCASQCTASATECVGTTGLHTCAADGSGWGSTTTQCADTSSLKACANGAFSGTSACPAATPYCVSGQCVACTGTTAECADNATARHCNAGSWVSTQCTGSTPVCSGGACVPCTSASSPTCVGSNVRQYCSGNSWTTATCSGTTPLCQSGACVQCTSASAPNCVNTNTVQSCAGTSWVQTTCAAPNPSCYQGACRPCNGDTAADCSDGTTRRYCNAGAFATATCNVPPTSTTCYLGACVGCNPSTAAAKCASTNTLSTCSATGSWVDTPCPAATPVCAGTPGKCVQCAPDSAWVCSNSTTRHSCTNNTLVDQACATGQICDPADATCKTPTCATGQYRCSGNLLQQCNANRTGWTDVKTCSGTTPVCSGGACVVCTPNATECVGATGRHVCAADGSAWGATTSQCLNGSSLATCVNGAFSTTGQACPSTAPACVGGKCLPCSPGATECVGTTGLHVCSADGSAWGATTSQCADGFSLSTCVNGAFSGSSSCSAGTPVCAVTGSVASCTTATCAVGQTRCVGNSKKQQVCNATRTGWDNQKDCTGTTPVCVEASGVCGCVASSDCSATPATPVCTGGQCVAATCAVGQYRCSGNTLQLCNAARTGWDTAATCTSSQVCDATGATCKTAVCATGQYQCTGSTLQLCSAGRMGWDTVTTCTSSQVCDATGGTCQTAVCASGQYQCTGSTLQLCSAGRMGWDTAATCATSQLCDAVGGTCGTPVCAAGQNQCSGATLQVCNAGRTGWDTAATCATSQLCDAVGGTCQTAACAAGQYQCSGATLQVCNAGRTGWDTAATCASSQLCDAVGGTCGTAACAAGQYQCSGATLQVCNTGRTGWDGVTTCATSQLCDAVGGTCGTPVCAVGQYECSGATLQLCNAARTGWDTVTTCATSQLCDAVGGTCGTAVCAVGQYQCSGATQQLCNAGRTGWDNVMTCSGTTPVCTGGFCVGCTSDADCGGSVGSCQTDGSCLAAA